MLIIVKLLNYVPLYLLSYISGRVKLFENTLTYILSLYSGYCLHLRHIMPWQYLVLSECANCYPGRQRFSCLLGWQYWTAKPQKWVVKHFIVYASCQWWERRPLASMVANYKQYVKAKFHTRFKKHITVAVPPLT